MSFARPPSYPEPTAVPEHKRSWQVPWPDYDPPIFTAEVVRQNNRKLKKGGWADPPLPPGQEPPKNPRGRQGIAGRGLLGRWGANQAADPMVFTPVAEGLGFEMVLIKRRDNGAWAIPGGMVDAGENVSDTLARELFEETGLRLDFSEAIPIYEGYVEDPRNTDHAWMETTARALVLSSHEAKPMHPTPGDDAADAAWVLLTEGVLDTLYANHAMMVRLALKRF